MCKTLILFLAFLFKPAISFAHIGSAEVLMQGNAGPYKILVSIQPPDVIPGVAEVKLYLGDADINSITIRAVYFRTGRQGAPAADDMRIADHQPGLYIGNVWLMNGGSSSVEFKIKGNRGEGEMLVPVLAIATAKKVFPASTAWLLLLSAIFLFVFMITIVGASVSDALTEGGEPIAPARQKSRVTAMVIAALFILLVAYGESLWWRYWANDYAQYMFQPTKATSSVSGINGANELRLMLDTSGNAQRKELYAYIVPDHGKMMHVFVVRFPAMDAFAHLHPVRVDEASYRTLLPGLPKGKYLLFADIVYVSGFTETIKDSFEITANTTDSLKLLDRDDAYELAIPADIIDNRGIIDAANTILCGNTQTGVKLKDGSTMVWEGLDNGPLEVGKLYSLQFAVLTPEKKPANLESYMGMAGHAAIIRNDGNVYVHLHPMGTTSMAAATNFEQRIADPKAEYSYPYPKPFRDSIDHYLKYLSGLSDIARENVLTRQMNMPGREGTFMTDMAHNNMVEFPYSFPSPGQYRIWVQVKRNGEVFTAAFDKIVR